MTVAMLVRRRTTRAIAAGLLVLGIGAGVSCASGKTSVAPLSLTTDSTAQAVKAHLTDGSTVVLPHGVRVRTDSIVGRGARFGLRLEFVDSVSALPTAAVAGLESYSSSVNTGASFAKSALLAVGVAAAAGALAIAIFGSCPTVYADSAGTPVIQAEGFSYSIAPLFEARDVDRLSAHVGPDGSLRLEVRNEALETHFINALEVLDVGHASSEAVVADDRGGVLAVTNVHAPSRVRDRSGRDLLDVVRAADERAFSTSPTTLRRASAADLYDTIEIVAPRVAGADSTAIVLRARNSLFNTVLFYDHLLRAQGVHALEWIGSDLRQLSTATGFASWASSHLGLQLDVWDGGSWRAITHIMDPGPIAWHDVAVMIPAAGDSTRVRLTFVADAWRFDRIAIADRARHPDVRTLLADRVEAPGDSAFAHDARASLRRADSTYVETNPGDRFWVTFEADTVSAQPQRTFFLVSQGYYTEWIRPAWITETAHPRPVALSAETLAAALDRWRIVKNEFETRFFRDRVPVR